jgi:hypothetical protein
MNIKITKGKVKELLEDHRKYNKFLKSIHDKPITFDKYVDQVFGVITKEKRAHTSYQPGPGMVRRTTKIYPSAVAPINPESCAKRETKTYSGSQRLLGIATLHKSNMVPVFDRQTAEDIAKMRRN